MITTNRVLLQFFTAVPAILLWPVTVLNMNTATNLQSNDSKGGPSASKVDVIRGAALRMFVDEGYQSVSLRQLAEEVGMQAGSLYNHIESKQCLLFEFIEEHEFRLLHAVTKTRFSKCDLRSALGQYVGAYLRFALNRRDWHILSARESYCLELSQKKKIEILRANQMKLLKEIISLGVTAKRFQVEDLSIAATAVRAMLDGVVLGQICNDFRVEVLIKSVQQMVLRSLLTDQQ